MQQPKYLVPISEGENQLSCFPPTRPSFTGLELRRALSDSAAPAPPTLSICKDFNNEPLSPNHRDRSGVNKGLYMCKLREDQGPIKAGPWCESCHNIIPFDITWLDRLLSSTASMVKYFSVEWLAQSHHSTTMTDERIIRTDSAPMCRPHVPCMVQPRAPTYGRGYLQAKPKPSKPAQQAEQEPSSCSPLRSINCSSPISEVSGYSSGYESEAASSDSLSVDEGGEVEKDGPQRRLRTKFTPEQISKLENIFSKHKYLDSGERVKTAQKLNLTETQVRTWFQNRRMKLKREVQDYLAPQIQSVTFQPLPSVQYHVVAGQRPQYAATGRALYTLPVPELVLQRQMPLHQSPRLMIQHPRFY